MGLFPSEARRGSRGEQPGFRPLAEQDSVLIYVEVASAFS